MIAMEKGDKIAAVVLAAGKGVRMKSKKINKVMLPLNGKPMILYTVELLKKLGIGKIVVVVGFAKEALKNLLGPAYLYAEQRKKLGTAHALRCGLEKIPESFNKILVLNGDDSAFYLPETIRKLIDKHKNKKAALTMLTIETENPYGLGRILRDKRGEIIGIVEEKDATERQRKIKEINPACYIFERAFLKTYLPKIRKSPFSGEYYLTDLVKLGIDNREKVESVKVENISWRGINTWEELKEAGELMKEVNYVN